MSNQDETLLTKAATIASRLCLLAAILLIAFFLPLTSFFPRTAYGPILHEEQSEFSLIRIRGNETKRHLLFVSDSGREGLQSTIDLNEPGTLQVAYTQTLFASHLLKHPQDRVLIVGLGGGGMVRFLAENFPETQVEVVEIDPVVVRLADQYFETREEGNIRIHTLDAFKFLASDTGPFDVIYMDAFLRPSVDSDPGSKTARLKTVEFLETIEHRLNSGGVLACNLITHRESTPADIASLKEVFSTVKQVAVPGSGNLVVLGTQKPHLYTAEEWSELGEALANKLPVGLPFGEFAKRIH
ncbi:MAG: fused MFS/spermidine synthase [Verrucomicrobiota bacterium]